MTAPSFFQLHAATTKARAMTGDRHIGTQVARGLVDVVHTPPQLAAWLVDLAERCHQ